MTVPAFTPGTAGKSPHALALAKVLIKSGRVVEAQTNGGSMTPSIPRHATIRVQRVDVAALAVGDVVSVEIQDTLVSHRIVGLARTRSSGVYVVTRGDAVAVCDMPFPLNAVIGAVTAYRDGDEWRQTPGPHLLSGWRRVMAAALTATLVISLRVNVQFACGLATAARRAALWRSNWRGE